MARGAGKERGGGAGAAPGGPGLAALWFGLLGAPLAWSLQLVVAYAIVAAPCVPDPAPGGPVPEGIATAAVAVSAALVALAGAALWTAVACWRAAPSPEGADPLDRAARHRIRFMSYSGIFTSALFTLGTALATIALLVLDPCG